MVFCIAGSSTSEIELTTFQAATDVFSAPLRNKFDNEAWRNLVNSTYDFQKKKNKLVVMQINGTLLAMMGGEQPFLTTLTKDMIQPKKKQLMIYEARFTICAS